MALPVEFGTVTLAGKYVDLAGVAVAGQVTFTAPVILTANDSDIFVVPKPNVVTLDANGAFTVVLPATNDPDISPTFTYQVTEYFISAGLAAGRTYSIELPYDSVGTIQLADLAPVTPFTSGSAYVLASTAVARANAPIYAADYGVVADGSDCADELRAAITALGSYRRRIILPAGEIRINSTIPTIAGLIIEGEEGYRAWQTGGTTLAFYGTGALFEMGSDNGHAWTAAEYDGPQGFELRNVHLQASAGTQIEIGDGQAGGAEYRAGTLGIRDWRGGNVRLTNVFIEQFETGFWGIQSDYAKWQNVQFNYCKTGMYLGPRSDQGTFDAVDFYGCRRAIDVVASGAAFNQMTLGGSGNLTTIPIRISPDGLTNSVQNVVFDQPWLEMQDDAGVVGAIPAWFEIGEDSAYVTGTVEIRSPYIANTGGSGTTIDYFVQVANVTSTVIITNPTGYGLGYFAALVHGVGSAYQQVQVEGSRATNGLGTITLAVDDGPGIVRVIEKTQVASQVVYRLSGTGSIAYPGDVNLTGSSATLRLGSGSGISIIDTPSGTSATRHQIAGTRVYDTTANELFLQDGKNLKMGTTTGSMVASSSSQKLGFWGATPAARPTVTGSKASGAALTDLLAKLVAMGLIVDGTTA